jgi:hypothetical protein
MCRFFPFLFAGGLGLCLAPSDSGARLLDSWPYDKLMKKSDLVVIAKAIKTEVCADKYLAHSWTREFAGQNTTFEVIHTLKGKADRKQIKVLHFSWGDLKQGVDPKSLDAFIIIAGPLFVAFRTDNSPEYLLYLKALKDGRYEPISGKIDPKLAIRVLSEPDEEPPIEK